MPQSNLAQSAFHDIPSDMQKELLSNTELIEKWNTITPIARNEWICWVTIVKKEETRKEHLKRMKEDLLNGKKRPCCWPGCPHKNKNAQKWFT